MVELTENLRGRDSPGQKGLDTPESPVFWRRHRRIAKDLGIQENRGLPEYSRRRARLAGRLPNSVTLSVLIMKVDVSGCCFVIPRSSGTFFLHTFVESFEFPGLRDAAARRRRLLDWGEWREVFATGDTRKM